MRRGARARLQRRDYAGLAGLAGYGAREFRCLDGAQQRAARVAIDRELELRKARQTAVVGSDSGGAGCALERGACFGGG